MSETKENESTRKNRLSTNNFNLFVTPEANCPKRKRQNKGIIEEDVIEISEQSLPTSQKKRRETLHCTSKNNKVIIYQNCKPMPSLTDLEKLFEDCDENENPIPTSIPLLQKSPECYKDKVKPKTTQQNLESLISYVDAKSPCLNIPPDNESSILPQASLKTNNVNCKHHLESSRRHSVDFYKQCYNNDKSLLFSEEEKPNISQSIFNAQDNVTSKDINSGDTLCNDRKSNKITATYCHTTNSASNNQSRPFSPLPSTSKDNNIILHNEKCFKESLICNNTSSVRTKKEKALLTPCETIVIDDKNISKSKKATINKANDIYEDPVNNSSSNTHSSYNIDQIYSNDTCETIIIDDAENNNETLKNDVIISTKHIQPNTVTCMKKQQRSGKNDEQHVNIKNPSNIIIENIDLTKNIDTSEVPSTIDKYSNPQQDYGNNVIRSALVDSITEYSHNDINANYNLDETPSRDTFLWLPKSYLYDRSRKSRLNLNESGTALAKTNGKSVNKKSNTKNNVLQEKMSNGIGDCPICYEKLSTKLAASTICGHVFCMDCIKTATRNQKKCPNCRKYLKGVGFHPLFL